MEQAETLSQIFERFSYGERPRLNEVEFLLKAGSSLLPALASASRRVKLSLRGDVVSYSRKVFIPLTRLCRNSCAYCGFRQPQPKLGEIYLKPRQVLALAEAGARAGCFEALFTLGEKPEEKFVEAERELKQLGYGSTIEYLYECCRLVFKHAGLLPHSNPGILTREELKMLREVNVSLGLMLENVSPRLRGKGGPHELSPGKEPKLRLATLEEAGKLRIAFTTGILLGIGETPAELAASLQAILEIHQRYGHIQEVIIQPFKAKPGTPMAQHPEPETSQIMAAIAVASLLYLGDIPVQTPPNLWPGKLSQAVEAGIDDWGGVSPVTPDHVNPERAWPHVSLLKEAVEGWGLKFKVRLPIYPRYVLAEEFIPEAFREAVKKLTDEKGYVRGEIVGEG